jgi:hypothetical protein
MDQLLKNSIKKLSDIINSSPGIFMSYNNGFELFDIDRLKSHFTNCCRYFNDVINEYQKDDWYNELYITKIIIDILQEKNNELKLEIIYYLLKYGLYFRGTMWSDIFFHFEVWFMNENKNKLNKIITEIVDIHDLHKKVKYMHILYLNYFLLLQIEIDKSDLLKKAIKPILKNKLFINEESKVIYEDFIK